jgi:DNA invertase Pin-like site-specific DNA recombinase
MKIGYARVSTRDQNLNLQLDALNKAGCEKIYKETASGAMRERPEMAKMMATLRKGDTVVVYKLDRLGRSLQHLLELVSEIEKLDVSIISVLDAIDTSTPNGRLVFNIFGSLAQFERELIKERTLAGLASARARGRSGGRPKGLSEEAQKTAIVAEALHREGHLGVNEIAKRLQVSKATLYKYLRHRGVAVGKQG